MNDSDRQFSETKIVLRFSDLDFSNFGMGVAPGSSLSGSRCRNSVFLMVIGLGQVLTI